MIEGEIAAVRQRPHETVAELPVRVYTVSVVRALKGAAPDPVTLVLVGGYGDDGSFTASWRTPVFEPGDHVLLFARPRRLPTGAAPAEAGALQMNGFYRRVDEGLGPVTRGALGAPVTLDDVEGRRSARPPVADDLPDGAREEEAPAPAAPVPVEWTVMLASVEAQLAAPGPTARPGLDLSEVQP